MTTLTHRMPRKEAAVRAGHWAKPIAKNTLPPGTEEWFAIAMKDRPRPPTKAKRLEARRLFNVLSAIKGEMDTTAVGLNAGVTYCVVIDRLRRLEKLGAVSRRAGQSNRSYWRRTDQVGEGE